LGLVKARRSRSFDDICLLPGYTPLDRLQHRDHQMDFNPVDASVGIHLRPQSASPKQRGTVSSSLTLTISTVPPFTACSCFNIFRCFYFIVALGFAGSVPRKPLQVIYAFDPPLRAVPA
jgi:hypothetical protein